MPGVGGIADGAAGGVARIIVKGTLFTTACSSVRMRPSFSRSPTIVSTAGASKHSIVRPSE
jgi:hypothetical protein